MPKFYHFCEDQKFINSGYERLYPGNNKFLIYGTPADEIKHIKLNEHFHFIELEIDTFKNIPDDGIVIFHSIPEHLIRFLKFLPRTVKIVWLVFGFEVYNDFRLYPEKKSLDEHTYKVFGTKKISLKSQFKELVWPIYRKIKPTLYLTEKEHKLAQLKRVDFLGCSFKDEYDQIVKFLGFKRPLFKFWYYPLEDILEINAPIKTKKEKILVGNSGFKTVNHLDVFSKLKNMTFEYQEIIVPFSYGDPNYMQKVKNLNPMDLQKVHYLENFMSLDKYNELLMGVKIAIFNTRRQQAIGNIISLIYAGAKVFVSDKNPFFHYLKKNDVQIYCYETELKPINTASGLSESEIKINRSKLFELLNRNKLEKDLQKAIQNLTNS